MNKILFFILFILCCSGGSAKAQQELKFDLHHSSNYSGIHSYSGLTSNNAYPLRFQYSGTFLNIPHWKVSVRLKNSIVSTDNMKVFPAEQISLQVVNTQGQAHPNPIPSVNEIGIPPIVALDGSLNEVFLIPLSNAPLYNSTPFASYFDLRIDYNLVIAGGSYLGDFPHQYTQRTFKIPLEFKAYGSNNELLGTFDHEYTLDVFPLSGQPPNTNSYTIQINGNARNALLEFKTLQDYISGVSVTYPNSVVVNSNTDYQVHVRSINASFTSSHSYTLPLDAVQVQLIPSAANTANGYVQTLSMAKKKVAEGVSTNNNHVEFDMRYFTNSNDLRFIEAQIDDYNTILEYEIIPQ